jgi:oligopeptide transport system substrate-binding protein
VQPAAPAATAMPQPIADSGERGRGTLRYGTAEPTAIVPGDAVTGSDRLIVDALFDSLTTYDAGMSVIPSAAVAWTATDDQRTWTFTLREGARFHQAPEATTGSGLPVTAADFKFSWERAVAEGAAGFLLELVEGYDEVAEGRRSNLRGVEAPDTHTLVVRLRSPLSTFPDVVAHPALGPLPRALWEQDPAAFREQPIGNGPFRAAETWARGQFIRVQRVAEWSNGRQAAHVDEVLFQFAHEDNAYVGFQQGRLHVSAVPQDAVQRAVEEFGAAADGFNGPGVLRGETPTLYFLGFDVTREPFDDPDIRRAVSLAIDRSAIVETVGANVAVADSLFGPGLRNGRVGTCDACEQDRAAARAIFEERGVERLRLWFNRDGGHLPVARRIRDDLAEVGVVLELQAQAHDLETYLTELSEGGPGMFRFGWTPEHAVADELLHPLFHSEEIGRRNYMRYDRADVDELIDEARRTPGVLRRVFLNRQAEDLILNRDQAIVPIMRYRHLLVVDDAVQGFRVDSLGHVNLAEVRLRAVE